MKKMGMTVEERGTAAVAWIAGASHDRYEDRYRLLPRAVPLVGGMDRGEVCAVFDGIGGYRRGMAAAQYMADQLLRFYREPDQYPATAEGFANLLDEGNWAIRDWGAGIGSQRSVGGCAGSVGWLRDPDNLFLFHAGDTVAVLLPEGNREVLTRLDDLDRSETPFFGVGAGLNLQVVHRAVAPDDRLLLISDGVTKVLDLRRAAEVVRNREHRREAAAELCKQSVARGSPDDVTVLVWDLAED